MFLLRLCPFFFFFFFNDTATTEIYTLSLHDALPICYDRPIEATALFQSFFRSHGCRLLLGRMVKNRRDRKSTRLNSSHSQISYAVFCLKKKKKKTYDIKQSNHSIWSTDTTLPYSHLM